MFNGTPGGIRFRSLNRRLSRLERARCLFRANELSSFAFGTPHWGDIRIVRPPAYGCVFESPELSQKAVSP